MVANLGYSLSRLLIGYGLAVGFGVVFGALMAQCSILREMFKPILTALMSVPTLAWVPILLIFIGLGEGTVIAAVFLGAFFVIAHQVEQGIRMVPTQQIRAARTLGLRGPRLFLAVLLPGAMGSILSGLRLGMAYAWRALVGGEMLAALITTGVGKAIYQARFWNDTQTMLLGLLVIALCGMAMDQGIGFIEGTTVKRWGMVR